MCYNQGRRFFSSQFVLFIRQRENTALPWRVGITVTKKTGSAVWRNRVRRLVRECFRLHQHHMPAGIDCVVVPKKTLNPRTLTFHSVEQEILPLIRKQAKRAEKSTRHA